MFTRVALLRFRFCALLLLLSTGATAQPLPPAPAAPRYRNLVMEGGGIRSIACGGAPYWSWSSAACCAA